MNTTWVPTMAPTDWSSDSGGGGIDAMTLQLILFFGGFGFLFTVTFCTCYCCVCGGWNKFRRCLRSRARRGSKILVVASNSFSSGSVRQLAVEGPSWVQKSAREFFDQVTESERELQSAAALHPPRFASEKAFLQKNAY